MLTIDKVGLPIPSAAELLQYDIVLFSRARFEKEIFDGCTKVRPPQHMRVKELINGEG